MGRREDRGRPVVQGGARCEARSGLRPEREVLHTRSGWGTAPQDHEVVRTRGSEGEARRGPASLPSPRRSPRSAGPALSGARPSSPDIDCQLGGTGEAKGREGTGRRFGVLGEGMRFALGPGNAVTGLWRARGVTLALPAAPAGALQLLCRDSDRHSEPETPQRLATSPSHTRPTRPLCNALSDTRGGRRRFPFFAGGFRGLLGGEVLVRADTQPFDLVDEGGPLHSPEAPSGLGLVSAVSAQGTYDFVALGVVLGDALAGAA